MSPRVCAFNRRRVGSITVAALDREALIVEAICRCPELEGAIPVDWAPDDATCHRVGWQLAKYRGTTFRIGHRLLQLTAPGGYLLPPPEYQMCRGRETEPTVDEEYRAPYLHPWSLVLWQSGDVPAFWQLSGRVYHRALECEVRYFRLLYLHRDKQMARTDDGWLRLGRRFAT